MVTGAHGFIGRHIALQMAAEGYHVTGLGHGDWVGDSPSAWGIADWHNADVDGDTLVEHGGVPDLIAHCAGSGSVPYSLERPREDFRRTVDATLAVLDFVRMHVPDARLVLPSSAAVYGLVEELPIQVDAPRRPLSPYGVHKKMAEDLCRSYATHFGVRIAIVRLFSIYGPGLRKQLLWDACSKIMNGSASFGGDGTETRDWLHVEDASRLLSAAAAVASTDCPIFNGGVGEAVSVRAVVDRLVDRLGGTPAIFTGHIRLGDPRHFVADVSSTLSLDWRSEHALEDGLDAYADWFRRQAA
ncbi:NAD-dependent epimerase/dehydratase family protein [Novosphingobium sp. HR1a]|nr:NAD-dependent epimerase/dehydratase family protein [Novosphingobium sp. HR1a]